MTKTVGHYVESDTFGGLEQVVLTLLKHHNREGWRPVLIHHDEPGLERLVEEARAIGVTSCTVPRITRFYGIKPLWKFVSALRCLKLSVFHAHLSWPLGCRHALLAAKLARIPSVVATSHLCGSVQGIRFRSLKQYLHSWAVERYIAVSNEVRKCLVADLGLPNAKINVIRNGIDLSPFERSAEVEFRAELGGTHSRFLVLTPARLHPQKGHDYLLEAASKVPNAIFLLAGDGPDRKRLENRAAELGIQDRVQFLGHRRDITRLLANSDVFVLPSLYEGLPISVLEAMAAEKPVVATAIGGTDEIIVDGESGKLVAPRDGNALAASINEILSDQAWAKRLATAGRIRIAHLFSAGRMVHGVEELYEQLLGGVENLRKKATT